MRSNFGHYRGAPRPKQAPVSPTPMPPPAPTPEPPPVPTRIRTRTTNIGDRIRNALGKDITGALTSKTEVQLRKEQQDRELAAVDPEVIQYEMRKLRPGERLYNSLVSSKKTRKKRLPKSVRKRVEETKALLERNEDVYPEVVYDAIMEMN